MKPERETDYGERRAHALSSGGNETKAAAARGNGFLFEEILREDLMRKALDSFSTMESPQLREFLDSLEREIIIKALWKVEGNLREAARLLGVKYTTLHEKLKKHGIRFRRDVY